MNFSTDLTGRVAALRDTARELVSASDLVDRVSSFDDGELERFVLVATELGQAADLMRTVGVGAVAARSAREAGHSGFAQSRGHRSAASFVQQLTGSSRGEAARLVRVGESLFESDDDDARGAGDARGTGDSKDTGSAEGAADPGVPIGQDVCEEPCASREPWHAPLRSALMRGSLSAAQHDAIRRGLGEPPAGSMAIAVALDNTVETGSGSAGTDSTGFGAGEVDSTDADSTDADSTDAHSTDPGLSAAGSISADTAAEAWRLAAEQLLAVAPDVTVEDLAKHARAIRDLLDPEGAEARYLARYEQRSFRMWIDREGLSHGSFVFDDESAAWLRSVIDTALRPRRGGPRFVDPEERAAAKTLADDPRTNDQLAHDLLLDVLRAGTLADSTAVLGARQAGVRMVQVVDREEYLAGLRAGVDGGMRRSEPGETGPARRPEAASAAPTTRLEDDGSTIPAAVAAQQRCNAGIVPVIVDRIGNPLDVGREQRLYTSRQRVALAVRDGGCRWIGCDRPASYCEAHHIDEWSADRGRTDVDRGLLLCRFHHMQLHSGGWRITREGTGPFLLHPPGATAVPSAPIDLRAPLPLSYGWQYARPSPRPFRTAA